MSRRSTPETPAAPVTPDSPRMMKATEVADYLGVSHRSVIRWADDGILPLAFRTPGGHRRFRPEDVAAFKADRDTYDPDPT